MAPQLRQRPVATADELPGPELAPALTEKHHAPDVAHPSGKRKKSQLTQWLRGFSFVAYFLSCCVAYAYPYPFLLFLPLLCVVCCLSIFLLGG